MNQVLKVIFFTAIGYFLAGWLGQIFAIPPGYATVIWPASGVAISACLLFGYWPVLGVFIGSTFVNVTIGYYNTGQFSFLVPILIAAGSAVQTAFSYTLVKYAIGDKLEFFNIRHVVKFIVLAGPVGCLVSATCGTVVLISFGILSFDHAFLNWLSWWLGDLVGVIVLVPWLAVLFRRHFSVYYDHPMRVGLSLLSVALITVLISISTAYFELNKQRQAFNSNADLNSTLLSERIKNSVDILYSLAGYIRGSGQISPAEFARFGENIMVQDRAIKALSINHVLEGDDVLSYEAYMSSLYDAPFKISQRSKEGALVPVEPRDRYVSVGLIYPLEPNRKAVGFDVYSEESRREAIDQAIRLNAAFPTTRIKLVQNAKAVLMFLPVYKDSQLYAMATALFEIDDISARILDRNHLPNTEVYLVDRRANEPPYILATSANASQNDQSLFQALDEGDFPSVHRAMIPVGAHRWELIHVSHSKFIEQPWGTHFVLVVGLFVAGLLGWMLSLVFSHAAQVERQVMIRTKELSAANKSLREYGDKLKQATQEAQEANHAKSRFLANMSHEIRTPLNGMLGSLALLQSKALTAEQQKLVELAHQSGDSLLDLINDILDLSKIEAGELELEPQEFDLQDLLEDISSLMRIKADSKGLKLIAPGSLLPEMQVNGDRARIRQILVNLLGNAIKFTAQGGDVRLHTEVLKQDTHQITLKFSVVDTGIGISQSLQERLFQRFKQADASTTRRYGGTGLGLAISKELIDAMGGEIGLTSELGKGATFWFSLTLPVRYQDDMDVTEAWKQIHQVYFVSDKQEDAQYLFALFERWGRPIIRVAAASDLPPLDHDDVIIIDESVINDSARQQLGKIKDRIIVLVNQSGKVLLDNACCDSSIYKPIHRRALFSAVETILSPKLKTTPEAFQDSVNKVSDWTAKVLLVEDNLTNQIVAKGMLNLFGVNVEIAENGEVAVNKLREESFDLVFMDCQMPVMDGYEATRLIRQFDDSCATSSGVPIIALSANAMKGDDLVCFEAGMDDHVAKPVSKERLQSVLIEWLKKPQE